VLLGVWKDLREDSFYYCHRALQTGWYADVETVVKIVVERWLGRVVLCEAGIERDAQNHQFSRSGILSVYEKESRANLPWPAIFSLLS